MLVQKADATLNFNLWREKFDPLFSFTSDISTFILAQKKWPKKNKSTFFSSRSPREVFRMTLSLRHVSLRARIRIYACRCPAIVRCFLCVWILLQAHKKEKWTPACIYVSGRHHSPSSSSIFGREQAYLDFHFSLSLLVRYLSYAKYTSGTQTIYLPNRYCSNKT